MEERQWDSTSNKTAPADTNGNPLGAGNYFTFSFIYSDKDKIRPAFEVVSFSGNENLSFVYDFYLTIRSQTDNIPAALGDVILRRAVMCIVVQNHFAYYHGLVTEFRQNKRVGAYTQYELRLRAKAFLPYLNTRSDIYVGKDLSNIIDTVLKDNGFTTADYELRLTEDQYKPLADGYNRWSFVCQYEESDLNFLQRLMEREGVYYYFLQDTTWHDDLQDVKPEKMMIVDSKVSHAPSAKTLRYEQVGTPGSGPAPETIFTLIMHQAAYPQKVILRNYNYDKAGMGTMSAAATVGTATGGSGRVQTIYGENFSTTEEGEALARIRAEEIFCRTKVYYGIASGPGLTPGTLITVTDSDGAFSGQYLIIHADHTGKQPLPGIETEFQYLNTFIMIPAAVQFRPQRLAPKPKIHATMNAVIDGSMSWETPDIDKGMGRYKVRIPFAADENSNDDNAKWGKSTENYHVRAAGPFAGTSDKTHGIHFPLHKGTEVVLSFRDGDPDLPVISGAVYNSQNFNVVTEKNPKQHIIKTPGGNQLVMDDTPGGEYIHLYSPYGKQGHGLYIGKGAEESGVMNIKSSGNKHELVLGQEDSFVIGSENYVTIGSKMEAMLGSQSEFTMAMKSIFELAGTIECKSGHHVEFGKTTERIKDEDELLGTDKVTISAGLPPAEKAVLSTTAKALAFGGAAIGALLAAAGGDIAGTVFSDEASGAEACKQMGLSMAPITAGTLAQVLALTYLVKKVNTALTNALTKIELSNHGIAATALDTANEGIKIAVQSSALNIPTPNDYPALITLKQDNEGEIKIATGVKPGPVVTGGSITLGNVNVTTQKGNNQLVVGGASVNIQNTVANAAKFIYTPDNIQLQKQTGLAKIGAAEASLKMGANGFSATNAETKMVYGAKAIKINAGSVDIGGAVTIVGA